MESPHNQPVHAPIAETANAQTFLKRELNGATFMTLEHIGHMVLVVLVPLLVFAGLESLLSMWTGGIPGIGNLLFSSSPLLAVAGSKIFEAAVALGVVAALIVVVPLLVILDRRTRAEWHKRPAYASRLAYKVPLYTAIGVLIAMMIAIKIELLYIILASLAFIGVPAAIIGSLYLQVFLPLLVMYVVLAGTVWYLFKLAKGQDYGRKFSLVLAGVSAGTVIALFITSLVVLHSNQAGSSINNTSPSMYNSQYYQDSYNKYSQ